MEVAVKKVPAHVPAELVYDFDLVKLPGGDVDVHRAWKRLHDEAPDIFWTPRHGGHWVATRADDIDVMQHDHVRFSHTSLQVPRRTEAQPPMVPLEIDPPEHTPFRALLSPEFGPKPVRALEEDARKIIRELIENVYSSGKCDFVTSIAHGFPIVMFLRLVDLPIEDREQLLSYTEQFVRGRDEAERLAGMGALAQYVQKYIVERRANPGNDLFSKMVNAKVDGRDYTPAETFGMLMNVLFGGLDTVASSLSFTVQCLIENPDIRRRLVADFSLIPVAIEEILRRYGIPNTARVITSDLEYKGIQFRAGESILLPKSLHGLDERRFPDPLEIKLDRGRVHHAAFGDGPHRCAGAGLARMELRVFLEEWLTRIPDFEHQSGKRAVTAPGAVNGMTSLPIQWDVAN